MNLDWLRGVVGSVKTGEPLGPETRKVIRFSLRAVVVITLLRIGHPLTSNYSYLFETGFVMWTWVGCRGCPVMGEAPPGRIEPLLLWWRGLQVGNLEFWEARQVSVWGIEAHDVYISCIHPCCWSGHGSINKLGTFCAIEGYVMEMFVQPPRYWHTVIWSSWTVQKVWSNVLSVCSVCLPTKHVYSRWARICTLE